VETSVDVLDVLTTRYAFAEIAALIDAGAYAGRRSLRQLADVQQLCAFGQRVLDLDAEDFGLPDAAVGSNVAHSIAARVDGDAVPPELVARSLEARVPQSAGEPHRGILGSLRPAFCLLLEVIAARWHRRETSPLVAAVHTASEYLPMLIWEPVLGHAGDPARMPASVGGAGSRWGDLFDRECPHTKAQKSAAERCLRVAGEQDSGWRVYLDRQHSIVSRALGTCASECQTRCRVIASRSPVDQGWLAARCRVAAELQRSAIVRLRHSAPVGHGLGVPSPDEVAEAWLHTRATLGAREPSVLIDDAFPLPGLPSLLTTLAGMPILPSTIIADTAAALRHALA
jgi:hypothetical protein